MNEEKDGKIDESGYLAKSMSVAINLLPSQVISAISASANGIRETESKIWFINCFLSMSNVNFFINFLFCNISDRLDPSSG